MSFLPRYTFSETTLSESSLKLFVNPHLTTFGSYINITGTIYPPLSVPINIKVWVEYTILGEWAYYVYSEYVDSCRVNSTSDGRFHYTWMPPGRGTFFIIATWDGDQDHFPSKSNTQKVKVIGGPGPLWLEVGSYLHYKHNIEAAENHIIYVFHGPRQLAFPGPKVPLDLVAVEEHWSFPSTAGRGFIYYINMTSRDIHGLQALEKQDRKTMFWIDPEITIGDKIQIEKSYYNVTGQDYVFFQGELREAWVLENPYRTLWYDKKLGILLKGTNFVHQGADYPYSIILYDTNIKFDSIIYLQSSVMDNSNLLIFTFKNYDPIVSNITLFDENKTIVDTVENVALCGWFLPFGTYYVQASIFYNEHIYLSDFKKIDLTECTELVINFLFSNLTILCTDIENEPLDNCIIVFTKEGEQIRKLTDSFGLTTLEAYYGNWTIEAYWMNAPVGKWNLMVNKTKVKIEIQCNVGNVVVVVVDQHGNLVKANIILQNTTYELFLTGYLDGKMESFTFNQIPLISYTLTIEDDFERHTYTIDANQRREVQIEVIIPSKPFIETPLGMATISGGVIAAIVVTIIVLKRRKP